MRFKNILLATGAAILAACATATPYQAATNTGTSGYTSQKIESNRFNVSFSGNSLTDKQTVETYLLHRAAELAVENGYDYFTVANEDTEKNTRVVATPSLYSNYGYRGFGHPYHSGFYTSYDYFHPRLGWSSAFGSGFGLRNGGSSFGGFGGRLNDPFYRNFDYREVTKFRANAQILMGRGTKPSSENAFDAREVLANLGPTIYYPGKG